VDEVRLGGVLQRMSEVFAGRCEWTETTLLSSTCMPSTMKSDGVWKLI
jgi:hypothetical protein